MTLRISENGPEFPSALVDSVLAGEVVFLCGTGISAPQLPDFKHLVERTYEALTVDKTNSEQSAFNQGRFEEVLGSLSRRLSDPDAVRRTVSNLLAVPEHPTLDQHRTILRLSRDLDNQISVVTTNFDTLLERAVREVVPGETPRDLSFAGQALPAPGSPSFSGIIHIHGRLADPTLQLERTPLVLTSADYGDAYMRSGWASRFLFDLARCKAIVLVGYSANDAPVRYFLNVLEADRARFPDLKPVYAFDAYEHARSEAELSWGTLAVHPLPYCKINPDTGNVDHFSLWHDLAALADIVDHPKSSRRERARGILVRPVAEVDDDARRELGWLFGGRQDLWSVAIDAIADPGWFTVFEEAKLWSTEDPAWVIPAWIAKNFEDSNRLECASEWQRRLGRPFTEKIEQRLLQADALNETWMRAWRLLCLVEPDRFERTAHVAMRNRLKSGVVLDSDLQKAVSLLAPKLVLSQSYGELREDNGGQPITQLGPRMAVFYNHGALDLIAILCGMPERAGRIVHLATAQLQCALELEAELDLIAADYDVNDFQVPSIEGHVQNEHHEGVNFLVRVLVDSLPQAWTLDRDRTRSLVTGLRSLPGRVGLRLCLHAMRNAELFDADETMTCLLSASDVHFWRVDREIALLLRDRAGAAHAALVGRVEERILNSGEAYYARYTIEPGQVDWRAHACDSAVWLRLNMLQEADALSKTGVAELSAIKERRDYLDRAVEDRDFFDSYSSGAAAIVDGDPAPIAEAAEDDRLRVAQELTRRPELDLQLGWSAYCRSDPQGALNSLVKAALTPSNGALWNEFLGGLAFGNEASKPICDDLAIRALDHLAGFDPDVLKPMASGLADLIRSAPRQRVADLEGWLERLWKIVLEQPAESLDFSTDIYGKAINAAAGKLTRTLLLEFDTKQKEGGTPSIAQLQRIRKISDYEGTAGQLGRAVLAHDLAFLLTIDRQCVIDILGPRISAANAEGAALRAVMLRYGSVTPKLTQVFGQAVMKGVVESESSDHAAATIASQILRPALADVRRDNSVRWGLTASDVAQVLREAPQTIRRGALEVLMRWLWLSKDEGGVEDAWRVMFGPFFKEVWPKERKFRDVSLTEDLIALAVGAGNEFPAALEQLRPYIVPFDPDYGSLHSIVASNAPENFPSETLSLLWLVCGTNSRGNFSEIAEIIDRLIAADANIEIDRRLQWLEHRAERFG